MTLNKLKQHLDYLEVVNNNNKDMSRMFYDCQLLTKINLGNINTENVENMTSLFDECISLTSVDLNNFNTKNV